MKSQTDISEKMRSILVDWLIEVHLKFKLIPETLYLTVNLIDRYLEREHVQRSKLQLVGVTAMLIASKYEEIYAPIVKDFVYITDNAYTKEEILAMERKMLAVLDFDIQTVSPLRFLERYDKVVGGDEFMFNMGKYLIELSLVQYRMNQFSPSEIAASALYLSMKMLKRGHWNDRLIRHSHFQENDLRNCAKEHFKNLQDAQTSSL